MSETERVFFVGELVTAYPGEWLALEVVDRDEKEFPKRVKLVATATSRLELRDKIKGRKDIYIKFAGPLAPAQYGFLY